VATPSGAAPASADQDSRDELGVVDRAREQAEGVEGLGSEFDARAIEQIERRLEPDDAAIGRRAEHRAAGLRPECRR
jgi:hypothetical protein